MSIFATIADALLGHRRQLESLGRRVAALERDGRLTTDAAGGPVFGAAAARYAALAGQEEFSLSQITGVKSGAFWPAIRLRLGGGLTLVANDDLPAPIQVYAAPDASPFQGATGLVRFAGVRGDTGAPVYITVAGEWNGFFARLTSSADAQGSYAWTQVINAPWTNALTSASAGCTRAYDYARLAQDSGVTQRREYPTNTVVRVWFDPTVVTPQGGRHFFIAGNDPVYGGCPVLT